jgi:hypothetical protein
MQRRWAAWLAFHSLPAQLRNYLKRSVGTQRIGQFAIERRGVTLQCREGDIVMWESRPLREQSRHPARGKCGGEREAQRRAGALG